MKINRESFLRSLDSVSPGLSPREVLEQSASLVFIGDKVMTFNDNIYCESPTELSGVKGAVTAKPLLEQLRKWKEDDIEVAFSDAELLVTGQGGQKAGFRLEKEIALPVESVEKPKIWKKLHDQFSEAIGIVHQCAGNDDEEYSLTCVHIHPEWVEATDRFQLCRWPMRTGVAESVLVKKDSIKHIVPLGMVEFSETDSWMHFRNGNGLILSCRRYLEAYPDVTAFLETEGVATAMPKGLIEAVACAEIFSVENQDNNVVRIELTNGKLNLISIGINGWYRKPMKVVYTGAPLSFLVAPKLLVELVKNHEHCIVSAAKLKVETGNYSFIAHLVLPDNVAVANDDDAPEPESQPVKKTRKKKEPEPEPEPEEEPEDDDVDEEDDE